MAGGSTGQPPHSRAARSSVRQCPPSLPPQLPRSKAARLRPWPASSSQEVLPGLVPRRPKNQWECQEGASVASARHRRKKCQAFQEGSRSQAAALHQAECPQHNPKKPSDTHISPGCLTGNPSGALSTHSSSITSEREKLEAWGWASFHANLQNCFYLVLLYKNISFGNILQRL